MKVKIDLDMTPQEARTLLGLPDVAALQDRLLAEFERRLAANLEALTPDAMVNAFLPAGLAGWDRLRDMLWQAAGAAAETPGTKKE